MQVILLERIQKLGNMGETVKVKAGFARNFLLPQGKALPATADNLQVFEAQRSELEADNASRRADAEKLAKTLEGVTIALERQASELGQLYGSVKPGDLQKALAEQGHTVPRGSVALAEPIKTVGEYKASVVLHPEVVVELPVAVTRLVA